MIKRETAILACAASALMSALLVSYHHKRKASNGVKVNFVSWCGGRFTKGKSFMHTIAYYSVPQPILLLLTTFITSQISKSGSPTTITSGLAKVSLLHPYPHFPLHSFCFAFIPLLLPLLSVRV
jgi:hypothetical protein